MITITKDQDKEKWAELEVLEKRPQTRTFHYSVTFVYQFLYRFSVTYYLCVDRNENNSKANPQIRARTHSYLCVWFELFLHILSMISYSAD